MNNQPVQIIGAGLAGLLAAHAWPNIPIIEEAARDDLVGHNALLRFRGDAVSRLTGIPFREVTVRKGIWFRNAYQPPSIDMANRYSRKVLGRVVSDRSIWNVHAAQRFIAPEDFYERLIEYAGSRISWGEKYDFKGAPSVPTISTAPLPVVIKAIIGHEPKEEFARAPIIVQRYRIPQADVFQTIYFPDEGLPIYRASITGDLLIVESVFSAQIDVTDLRELGSAFGMPVRKAELIDTVSQKYGKIIPLPDNVRKDLLFKLTTQKGIYSLGRFAQWRNILLDDVVDDIAVIKRLLQSGSSYDAARVRAS